VVNDLEWSSMSCRPDLTRVVSNEARSYVAGEADVDPSILPTLKEIDVIHERPTTSLPGQGRPRKANGL